MTNHDVRAALLRELPRFDLRPGDALPRGIRLTLHAEFGGEVLASGLEAMFEEGELARNGKDAYFVTSRVCPPPSPLEIRQILRGAIDSHGARPGVVPVHNIRHRVGLALRAAEVEDGLNAMIAEGRLASKDGKSVSPTDTY